MDIDLDSLEEIMKKQKDKKDNPHSRSRSREKNKNKTNSQDKTKKHLKDLKLDPNITQQDLLEKQIEEAKKQAEEAQRDDCTVLVQRINLDADERDLYQLFASANVGKVRDVRIVRDPRSGRSKGVAYVEFYSSESVLRAMTITGTKFMGQEIVVQASQAEKNRAAVVAKYKKDTQEQPKNQDPTEGPMRIGIEGLAELLSDLSENDLHKLFSPFGSIEYIEVPKNIDGKAEGVAYVQFKKTKDAKEAIRKMNGMKFKGKILKVAVANEGLKPSRAGEHIPSSELEAEEKGKLIEGLEARATLSKKLIRDDKLPAQLFSTPQAINTANVSAATLMEYGVGNEPSHCLILTNLFDPSTVDFTKEPTFFLDVKDDVIEACSEYGPVELAWVDQGSNGNVWVKFANANVSGAKLAQDKMNGRFFGGRKVLASYVPETVFNSKVNQQR